MAIVLTLKMTPTILLSNDSLMTTELKIVTTVMLDYNLPEVSECYLCFNCLFEHCDRNVKTFLQGVNLVVHVYQKKTAVRSVSCVCDKCAPSSCSCSPFLCYM
jgi:hypothetical protein